METPKIFVSEYRFCQILWTHEPVKSRELVALCAEHLGWKPTTTYTVIKRLSERGVLKNENTVVTSLISQDEAQTARSTSCSTSASTARCPRSSPRLQSRAT